MKYLISKYFFLCGALLLSAGHAAAQLPKRDLIVEVREVDAEQAAAYTAGAQPSKTLLAPQQVRVRNGEQASMQMGYSMAIQWVQSVSVQSSARSSAHALAANGGASVTNAVTWMDSGQSIKVQPRWPGKGQAVTVDIQVQSETVDTRIGTELPDQAKRALATTVSAPVGKWITVAFSGKSTQSGVYGSDVANDPRRLLQIRVLVP